MIYPSESRTPHGLQNLLDKVITHFPVRRGAGKPSLADPTQLPVLLPPPRQKIESDTKVCNHDFIKILVCAILLDPITGAWPYLEDSIFQMAAAH